MDVSSLGFQFVGRIAATSGTILGPYLMQKHSFLTLLHCVVGIFSVFLLLCCVKKLHVNQQKINSF